MTSISGSGKAIAGGFVGINKATIEKSTSSGCSVLVDSGICWKNDNCGGFVGKNDKFGSIDGCYAECIVRTNSSEKGGGFAGVAKNNSVIKNSECKTIVKMEFCYKQHKDAVVENCFAN